MASYMCKAELSDGNTVPVGSSLYGTCTTAANTAAKVVTMSNFDKLITGVTIHVKFTNANSASNPTLNVNNTGAITICRYGTIKPGTTEKTSWHNGAIISFTYDGTNWVMNDWINDDTIQDISGKVDKTGDSISGNLKFQSNTGITSLNEQASITFPS